MISRRVNSLRDEFYPDFEMVLHNRTLEYPSRKALKLERHNCFIFSPMVLGQQGAKLIFYQCLHYSLQPIYGLWNTIKSTMNNCVKKEDKSLSPWGGRDEEGMVHLLVYPVSLLFIQMNRKLFMLGWYKICRRDIWESVLAITECLSLSCC